MHQIRFRGAPNRTGGAYSAAPNPLADGFKELTSKGKEGKWRKERKGGEEGTETEGKGGEVRLPHSKFLDPPMMNTPESLRAVSYLLSAFCTLY